MWTRRHFLTRGSLGLLGAAGTCFALPGDAGESDPGPAERVPDGSASKGMITAEADRAINRGLEFLYTNRLRDGSFGTMGYMGNVAVTSLAAMAFMSAGHQPYRGQYGEVVAKAVDFILSKENVNGGHPGYLNNPALTPHGPMYGHGFATLFLAQVTGMVHDRATRERLHDVLRRAVRLILDCQNGEGGWRYTPESRDADISVTICQIMALRAARNAGIYVPKSKVDLCVRYVKACQDRMGGWFRYMKQGGGPGWNAFARTAAGVVALYSAGIYKGPEIDAGLRYLKSNRPNRGFGRPDMHYFYGHYYAVQAMWTAGGSWWTEWFPSIREELLGMQNAADGSWRDQICPHYATAMACIILQVPNNYLPILQK